MNYALIIRPLIGAGIGYITNYIAVKMMFRPLKPVKIGKITLPFTPGIIPKNKDRIAISIGNSISDNLLTEETLRKTLLSDEIKEEIRDKVIDFLNNQTENSQTVKEVLTNVVTEDYYNLVTEKIKNNLTSSIFDTVKRADLGKIIAEQLENAARDALKKSMLGLLGGNAIISMVSREAVQKIDNYIDENGKEVINGMVVNEIDKYTLKSISEITTNIGNSNIDLVSIIMEIYEKFVIDKVPEILKTLNISKIVSDKIKEMDVLEVEKLILEIMKKELNALVNLGAIIGFILGLINLLF